MFSQSLYALYLYEKIFKYFVRLVFNEWQKIPLTLRRLNFGISVSMENAGSFVFKLIEEEEKVFDIRGQVGTWTLK